MPDTPGLRARKKERTRAAIEEAALEAFEADGFEGTTIDEIAAAADISPRTFFHYFPSKDDVVLADYSARLDRIVEVLRSRPLDEAPWSALEKSFVEVASDFDSERDRILRRFRIIESNQSVTARNLLLQAQWEHAVARAVAERMGGEPQDLRPRLIAGAAIAAMRTSIVNWLFNGGTSWLPDHITYCFTVLGAGLDDPPGVAQDS